MLKLWSTVYQLFLIGYIFQNNVIVKKQINVNTTSNLALMVHFTRFLHSFKAQIFLFTSNFTA